MLKHFLPFIANRVNINGEITYQRPLPGLKRRLFDRIIEKEFNKEQRKIQGESIETLNELLDIILEDCVPNNEAFVLTIYSDQWNGIQVAHSYMNHEQIPSRTKDFGFSICFTFDLSFEQMIPYHEKYKKKKLIDADHFLFDRVIQCYDLNCSLDKEKVFKTVKAYFEECLGNSENEKYYFNLGSHGPIPE